MWYPILIMACAAIFSATAATASRQPAPKHPLVRHQSTSGMWMFQLATASYVVSIALLVFDMVAASAIFGILGLIFCGAGYVAKN